MTNTTTIVLDDNGWADLIDKAAQFHLKMTGEQFMKRLHNGEFDDPDTGPPGLMAVHALIPTHITSPT